MNFSAFNKTGVRILKGLGSRFVFFILLLATAVALKGCSITATRPVQEMSDTAAAIRAAREVQADTLTPELFRQANEWFLKARNEYKYKDFKAARDHARKARKFAEQAEFESIRNGANRTDLSGPTDHGKGSGGHYEYPKPTGSPAVPGPSPEMEAPAGNSVPETLPPPSDELPSPTPSGATPH